MSAVLASPSPLSSPTAPTRPHVLRQLVVVAAVFAAATVAAMLAGVRFGGPIGVIAAAIAAVVVVRRDAGGAATALGLGRTPAWRIVLWTLGGVVLAYLAAGTAVAVATKGLGWPAPRPDALGFVRGSLPGLLGMLAVAWTSAAIGEELLFRGFLQGRLRALFGGGRGAALAAVAVQAVLFGVAHAYQGPTGILVTGAIGLVFGLLYLRIRTLWPLVIAHGVVDTIGLVALYAGAVPA